MSDVQRIKILIVDPRRYTRNLLREILFSMGVLDVALVTNCKAAINALRAHYYDALFCDDAAGDIPGFMKALRRDTKTKNITVPAFLISTAVQEEEVAIARDAGMNGVIVKPLSVATIEGKLKLVLSYPRAWIATKSFIGPDRRISRGDGTATGQHLGSCDRRGRSEKTAGIFPVASVWLLEG